jgi:hypothetical protein
MDERATIPLWSMLSCHLRKKLGIESSRSTKESFEHTPPVLKYKVY